MLKPSYSELMDAINKESDMENVTSRYAIVIALSKRARQLTNGDPQRVEAKTDKAVSIAVHEMEHGYLVAYPDDASVAKEETETFDKGIYTAIDEVLKNMGTENKDE